MNPLVERHGSWTISVRESWPLAGFEALGWRRETISADARETESVESSAAVEVLQFGGGPRPRALVGGFFISEGRELILEVGSTGPMTLGASRECRSDLGGPLVRGLPVEFVDAVLRGFRDIASNIEVPAGTMRVQFGGYDEENSSPHAFAHASAALLWVVSKQVLTRNEPVGGLAELVAIW